MNALWNQKTLERPANNIWVASRNAIDTEGFASTLKSIIRDLESQDVLHIEAAILSRVIYRMKSKFRHDKGLKNMEKVNRALLNYLGLDLLKEYKDLRNYVEPEGSMMNLPTKQMIEYVLVRTQGFAKLMCRIEEVAKCAAEFFKARMSLGHSWTTAIIAYAVISRIWFLARNLVKKCCTWYNSMSNYVAKFKQVGPRWLPSSYNLPTNLKSWLDLPWIEQRIESIPLKNDGKETIFGLIKAEMDDTSELYVDENNMSPSLNPNKNVITEFENATEKTLINKYHGPTFIDDFGTSIDRKAFLGEAVTRKSDSEENLENKNKNSSTSTTTSQNRGKRLRVEKVPKSPQNKMEKSRAPDAQEVPLQVKGNKRKYSESNSEKFEPDVDEVESASAKSNKKTKPIHYLRFDTPGELQTIVDRDSCPGLDRLQWEMLKKALKKFLTKLEKCHPRNEKLRKTLLMKAQMEIENRVS
ncbi:uncharacterized protein LOC105691654 [Athalia rosae]|uniref:uncharacterized protein LOC105691654 n=1 Tax=Athalia rosae TaxID=37344 RepID=UPI0020342CDB|nr:uncharacterized protein LOC105691654 [Athalia rosae]